MAHTLPAPPQSILEVGANIGNNLRALRAITGARFYAVEPNEKARDILLRDQVVAPADLRDGFASSINFEDGVADLAFTSGVLIHVHPDQLLASLKEIYRCSARWIVCIEYFSDKPEMIPYRGHDDRLQLGVPLLPQCLRRRVPNIIKNTNASKRLSLT
jgi:SAM-dependent methyltransferase